ncbi:MAG: polyprenyl synthetase family protein [Minisyncoccota bacterium]
MDIGNELNDFKKRLDQKIEVYFDQAIHRVDAEDLIVGEALRYAQKFILAGGKRVRAAFMYYGYLASHGMQESAILDASMSIELIHAFLLMHDDIIDRDDMRHGITTVHQHYTEVSKVLFSDKKDAQHFGNSIAIILGDMLYAFGNDVIFIADFPLDRKFQALSRLQDIVTFTVIGQTRDLYIEYQGEASEEEILTMYRNKTARYTIEGPLHLGALLAGASQEILHGFSAYAIPLGIAFQIQDDILGIFGTVEHIGKSIGSDIEEGKFTLLVSRALRGGTPEQAERLRTILSRGEQLTKSEILEFQQILRTSGALDGVNHVALEYIAESRQSLEAIKDILEPKAYAFLWHMTDYMMHRQS